MKKEYVSPMLEDLGTLHEQTQGTVNLWLTTVKLDDGSGGSGGGGLSV